MTKTKKLNRSGAFFSLPLFWQGIKKIRIPGIAMAISVIGLNIIQPLTAAASDRSRYAAYQNYLDGKAGEWGGMYELPAIRAVDSFNEFAPLALLLLCFAPLLAFLMFSYLNDRGKSDFYHSIPQTRLCTYISFSAAIMAWLSAVLVATTAINLILWSTAVYHTMFIGEILAVMACILLASFLTMAMAILAMTLTGTMVSNLFVAALIFLAAPIVYWECFEAMYDIVPVYNVEESWTRLLSFENYYPFAMFSAILSGSSRYEQIIFDGGTIAYSFLLTLGLLIAGGVLYHLRRSEMANQSAPNKYLQHVYRCAVTLPLLLWPIMDASHNGLDTEHLWVIFLALILYVLYELATTKKIKTMLRSLPVFGILIAVCFAIYGGLYVVHLGVEADVPSRNSVKAVAVSPEKLHLDSDQFETEDLTISDERAIALVMEALEFSAPLTRDEYREIVNRANSVTWDEPESYDKPIDSYSYTPKVSYTVIDVQIKLKSGRVLHRSVWMEDSKWNELEAIYFTSEVYRNAYLSVPSPAEVYSINLNTPMDYYALSAEQSTELYGIFHAEYTALSVAQQRIVKDAERYGGNDYLPRMVVASTASNRSLFIYVAPDLLPKTFTKVAQYDLAQNPYRKQDKTQVTLTDALEQVSMLKISDIEDFKGVSGEAAIKYEFYMDLQLNPVYRYATENPLSYSGITFYHANFNVYDSKTTADGKNEQFDRIMAAVAVLRSADNLQDYSNTAKKTFHLTLSWSNFPPEVTKDLTYIDLHQYITLTPTEAATLISALGFKPLPDSNMYAEPYPEYAN